MGLSYFENYYLILSFIYAFLLACVLILIKVDWKKASISSVFFAVFFLTFYFYQPLLLIIDRLKSYTLYYSIEKPHFEIEDFLRNEYVIIGYVGTAFSNFVLPIHTDINISGYDTIRKRFVDAIKRYAKKKKWYLVIIVSYAILSFILYKIRDNDEEIEKKSIELVPFLLNCLIIVDFFKTIWLLGAFFPILMGELRVELNINEWRCNYIEDSTNDYVKMLQNNINEYLDKDIEVLGEAYKNVFYIIHNINNDYCRRTEILDLLKEIKENQDNYKIKLDDEKEIEKLVKQFDGKNHEDELASGVRKLIKAKSKIPRKIYESKDIKERRKNGTWKVCFPLLFIIIGVAFFIIGFEISLCFYDYENLSSPLNFSFNIVWSFFITFLYFILIYYSFLHKNSLTSQNIYGIMQTDTLCLLKFSENISGLITPVSFLAIGTKALGIFALRDNLTFMQTFDIPLVENIFISLKFDDIYDSYISIRMMIVLCSFFMTFLLNSFRVPLCCKKDKYIINWKINDRNQSVIFDEEGCCKNCYKK